jgi:hypothetical protein
MPTPTNHTVVIHTRFGTIITAPVVLVEDLGGGRAKVNVETNYHVEDDFDHPATYAAGSNEAQGTYRVSAKVFTPTLTYIYMGVFTRAIG